MAESIKIYNFLNNKDMLFSKVEPLKNIMLPSDIGKQDLIDVLGVPESPQNWWFQFGGQPMKIAGFVLTTYQSNLVAAKTFINHVLEVKRRKQQVNEADEKDKKPKNKAQDDIFKQFSDKTEIVINPSEKDVADQNDV